MAAQLMRRQESTEPQAAGKASITDAEFDGLCNELEWLAQNVAVLELPPEEKAVVSDVLDNARGQHFQLVLVSPFQGGKSTIFNTVCGGRELSPTGFGIKTSAAIAEARFLQGDEEEYAEVEWRSDAELLAGMEEILAERLTANVGLLGSHRKIDPAKLSIADPAHRDVMTRVLTELSSDPERRERSGTVDLLQAAHLTLEHYEEGSKLRDHTRIGLAKASSWLAFPVDWSQRKLEDFETTELAFLFLKRVVFHLKEPTLRRLRASLIDAPGLQASSWDSAITTDCIRNAHAVIFLLGSRGVAVGQQELAEIEGFRRFDLAENVFYGYNVREKTRHLAMQKLLPNDVSALRRAGLIVNEDQFSVFNALLAYRARQCELLLEGKLPASTVDALSQRALHEYGTGILPGAGRDALANARYLVEKELKKAFEAFTGTEVNGISEALAHQAGKESHWEELIARASSFVIGRKGEAILLDRGARKLLKVLDRLDADLSDREKAAERDAGAMEREKEAARTALEEFEDAVEGLVATVERQLAEKGGQALLDELRKRLEKTGPLQQAMGRVIAESSTPRNLAGRLAKEAVGFAEGAIAGWQASLNTGTSRALQAISESVVKPAEQRLRKLSESAATRAPGLLSGGVTSLVPTLAAADLAEISTLFQRLYKASFWNLAGDQVEDVLGELGLGAFASWMRTKINAGLDMHEQWRQQIPTAVNAFRGAAAQVAEKIVEAQVKEMGKVLSGDLQQAARQVRGGYERRIQQREEDLKRTVEEKERIVREAAQRRQALLGVRSSVQEFIRRASGRLEAAR